MNWRRYSQGSGRQAIMPIFALLASAGSAMAARSPLGIGVAEQSISPISPWAGVFLQIQAWQMQFERAIQKILVGMREEPEGALLLIGLSFLYGIFHAAGPGHGKAVIASYLVADHASLKRGIILSFFSSILQALSAIAIMMAIFLFLPGQLTKTTSFVVTLSYALVALVGLSLLVRQSLRLFQRSKQGRRSDMDALFDNLANPTHPHGSVKPSLSWRALSWRDGGSTGQRLPVGQKLPGNFRQICAQCGRIHAIAAGHGSSKMQLRTSLLLIAATGLRPCNGALFVMSFALLNQLEIVGMMAVFAMASGTFITVAILACLALYAKNLALIFSSGRNRSSARLKRIIEWAASLFIFITGILLLGSSLI